MKDFYIDVLIIVPLDNLFTYKTSYKIKIGSIINVPFGNNNEIVKGIVISKPYLPKEKFIVKDVISVENYESILSLKQIQFLKWASTYYLVSLPKIFNSIFSKKILSLKVEDTEEINFFNKNKKQISNLIIDNSENILNHLINEIDSKKIKHQILILSPNTFQTQFIYKYFDKKVKNVHIYDAKTPLKNKLIIWEKILKDEELLVLGSKSAVFLPFQNLNTIYVMNEHDFLYKEKDKLIRYNARDCALILSKIHNCNINLISDSPSVDSIYNVKNNKLIIHDKFKKLNSKTDLSKVSIINKFEKQLKNGIDGILSLDVLERIENNYNNKKKTIVFTPYSENVKIIFDTITNFNKSFKIFSLSKQKSFTRKQLDDFYNRINDYDIIIGNYSVIDSLESFDYSLLVLIDPDRISSLSYYKSNEIFFQLIFKVLKKVNNNKKLVLQLINTNSNELKDNIRLDYFKIVSKEMNERKIFEYAPYKRLISIEMNSKKKNDNKLIGKMLFKELKNKLKFCNPTDIGIVKKKEGFIYKVYLKLDRVKNLSKNKNTIYNTIKSLKKRKDFRDNFITIDVDP